MKISNRQINTNQKFAPKNSPVTLTLKEDLLVDGIEFKANTPQTVARSLVKKIVTVAKEKYGDNCIISID